MRMALESRDKQYASQIHGPGAFSSPPESSIVKSQKPLFRPASDGESRRQSPASTIGGGERQDDWIRRQTRWIV